MTSQAQIFNGHPQLRPMGEFSSAGILNWNTGSLYDASVDTGNQLVKSTGTIRENPLQCQQVLVQDLFSLNKRSYFQSEVTPAPSTMFNPSTQPRSHNIENHDEGLMTYLASLSPQEQAKVCTASFDLICLCLSPSFSVSCVPGFAADRSEHASMLI